MLVKPDPDRRRRSQRERTETTRAGLVRAARTLFAAHGYHGVSAERIVGLAGVTSGALYHHFRDKRALFLAAFEEVEAEVAERVRRAAAAGRTPWSRLERGVKEYLAACTDPDVRRLVLVDGPSVLGWEVWREADARYHLRALAAALASAMRAGLISRRPPLPLARILLGALTEAGLSAGGSSDSAVLWLLGRMRDG